MWTKAHSYIFVTPLCGEGSWNWVQLTGLQAAVEHESRKRKTKDKEIVN